MNSRQFHRKLYNPIKFDTFLIHIPMHLCAIRSTQPTKQTKATHLAPYFPNSYEFTTKTPQNSTEVQKLPNHIYIYMLAPPPMTYLFVCFGLQNCRFVEAKQPKLQNRPFGLDETLDPPSGKRVDNDRSFWQFGRFGCLPCWPMEKCKMTEVSGFLSNLLPVPPTGKRVQNDRSFWQFGILAVFPRAPRGLWKKDAK